MSAGERAMLDRLNVRYGGVAPGNGIRYTRAEHVKSAAGFDHRRVCDYMALDLWPGGYGASRKGPLLHGHEVKVSRADWLVELRDPSKSEEFAQFCDFWWLVVSDRSIVKPGELPEGWGLMVASGRTTRVVTSAPRREPIPLTRDMLATLSRAVTKTTIRLVATGGDQATEALARSLRLDLPESYEPDMPEPGTLEYAAAEAEADGTLFDLDDESGYDGP